MRSFRAVLGFFVLSVVSFNASAQSDDPEVALQGYSPVSYFTVNRAEQGSPDYKVVHENMTYYFTSADQVALFEKEPTRYLPRFGQLCPYSLALGKKLPIDPTNFKVVGDTLLLFHQSTENGNGLAAFNKSEDPEAILERAQSQLLLLKF